MSRVRHWERPCRGADQGLRSLEMITRHPASRTLIIHPVGDLDALKADHYRRQLRTLIDEGYRYLIFDLQDTPHVNSSGLGLLVEFYNTIRRIDGSLKLINCSQGALLLLRQTQLDRVLMEGFEATPPEQTAPGAIQFDSLHALMSDEILILTQIHRVTERIMELEEPRAIGEAVLSAAIMSLKAERGAFLLLDDSGKKLMLTHWQGRDENDEEPPVQEIFLKLGRLESEILEQGELVWHQFDSGAKAQETVFTKMGFGMALAAPVHGNHRAHGLMVIEAGPETARIVQAARPLVRTFTNLCGFAIEKILLGQQLRAQSQELNGMIERARDYHQSLIDAGKLAAMGVVVGGLSHLINNKMVPLMGYSQMLARKKDLPEWVTEKVARIHESSAEMNHIVEKLVKVSHLRERIRKPVDQGDLVRTALDLISYHVINNRIAVHAHLTRVEMNLQGDRDALLQALLAVLHRACTSFTEGQRERWIKVISTASEQNLRIIIEDNGAPFDEYDQQDWLDPIVPIEAMTNERIFNYTIPRSILRRHKGTLNLETRSEGGKRVLIDLPLEPMAEDLAKVVTIEPARG